MAPTNVDLLTPGRIVFVQDLSILQDSRFGIIIPSSFWEEYAPRRQKEALNSCQEPHIPIYEMREDFFWRTCFVQRDFLIPHENLLDPHENLKRFRSFTYRDGSRYYKKFHEIVSFFHEKILSDLLGEEPFVDSLIIWKRENQK